MNMLNTVSVPSLGKAASVSRTELRLNEQAQAEDHRISKANKRFASAKPATQRVIIAKDVLKWLRIGKLKALPGSYILSKWAVSPSGKVGSDLHDFEGPEWGKGETVVGKVRSDRVNGGSCAACALGGLFACAVERADGLKDPIKVRGWSVDFWDAGQDAMHVYLAPYFSTEQLALIESAFERSNFLNDVMIQGYKAEGYDPESDDPWSHSKKTGVYYDWTEKAERAIEFGRNAAEDASDRMAAIMRNIIANNGTFVV